MDALPGSGSGRRTVAAPPSGPTWALPAETRHLATHAGHLVELTERDREGLAAGNAALIPSFTLTGPPDDVRARVDALAAQGVTEVAFQPMGDIGRELRAFAAAMAVAP